MTEPNIFQELEDDLQREKYEELWRKIGPFVIGAAFLIIATTAIVTTRHSWEVTKNQKATQALMQIDEKKDAGASDSLTALEQFANANEGSAQADIARLQAAALAAGEGNTTKALELYKDVEDNSRSDVALRQLAALRAVEVAVDTGDATELIRKLEPLSVDGAPWQYSALEASGFLLLKTGDKVKAANVFNRLAHDPNAPRSIAERAVNMSRFLGD